MAIVEPNEMNFNDKKFSVIICGAPGVGKTTLALSAPKPILIDLDKGISRVRAQHRTTTIIVDSFEELKSDLLSEEIKQFETIVIDTGGSLITLMQDFVMRADTSNKTKSGTISIKGFGAVKQEFINFVNTLKTIYNKNIIFIFHTVEEKNKDGLQIQRLMCEGSARNIVWQPCDLGCFVFPNGNGRAAGFTPTDEYFAKGCYGINGLKAIPTLDEGVKNDFMTKLFNQARENIASESKFFNEEKLAYEQAIAIGRNLAESIINAETMNASIAENKLIPHALTSEIEVKNMLGDMAKKLSLVWDKKLLRYVDESTTAKAEGTT